jgi:hypothetical protein
MIIPPSEIQASTPTLIEPSIKKSRKNNETEDDQVTLTQIWTPHPTQVLDFEIEATQEEEPGLTEEEIEQQQKLAAVVNPYLQRKAKKTPMVTLITHTKNKSIESATGTNLKDPSKYPTPDKAPTQELEDIMMNTEKILDQATAAFHQQDGTKYTPTQLTLGGIGTLLPTTESRSQMGQLIQYIDALNAKYTQIIKEHDELISKNKESFQNTLYHLTQQHEQQAKINMERIITSESSNVEQNMRRKLQALVKPQAEHTIQDMLKILDRKFET